MMIGGLEVYPADIEKPCAKKHRQEPKSALEPYVPEADMANKEMVRESTLGEQTPNINAAQ